MARIGRRQGGARTIVRITNIIRLLASSKRRRHVEGVLGFTMGTLLELQKDVRLGMIDLPDNNPRACGLERTERMIGWTQQIGMVENGIAMVQDLLGVPRSHILG